MIVDDTTLRRFLDQSPLASCIRDADSTIQYANAAMAKLLGRPLDSMIGQSSQSLMRSPAAHAFCHDSDDRVLRHGETVAYERRWEEGEPGWWQVYKFAVDQPGAARLIGMVAVDASEHVGARTALRTSEALFQAVVETAVDAIVIIDSEGRIESFNIAATRMFGYALEEVLGQNVKMLMPPPWRDEHDEYLRRYQATGERRIIGIGREVAARRKDGSEFPVDLAVSEVRIGDIRGFTGVLKDLSEQKRIEAELQQRSEEARYQRDQLAHLTRVTTLGEMAAGIAHEVNQPLAAINTYAQACQRMVAGERFAADEIAAALDKIATQAQRAGDIIRRVRALAQPTARDTVVLDLKDVVDECIELSAHEARIRGIELRVDAQDLAPVRADRILLQQVVLNLMRNSMDALEESPPEHPEITIRSQMEDDSVTLRVIDNGPGIDVHTQATLFNHFATSKRDGMGMGLSISRSIVETSGGSLVFEPRDDGACFRVSLPAEH